MPFDGDAKGSGSAFLAAFSCLRIQVAVVVAAWVVASCWVWLDWGGGLKAWSAPGMTWRVARGGGCRTGGVVRHGPPKTSARLTANGLSGEVFDYGLEFFEVGEFVVAVALDEERGDGDVRKVGDGWDGHGIGAEGEIPRLRCAALGMTTWVGDGVVEEDAPACG